MGGGATPVQSSFVPFCVCVCDGIGSYSHGQCVVP